MDRREPPALELADPIAERGEQVVPFLVDQLNTAGDDKTVDDIVVIFEAMARLKKYNVSKDGRVMPTVTAKVSSMKSPAMKTTTEKALDFIKNQS